MESSSSLPPAYLYVALNEALEKLNDKELDQVGRYMGVTRYAFGSNYSNGDIWYRARLRTVMLERLEGFQ